MARNIHLIFKTHLDVGFTDHAAAVIDNYFKKYIPAALRVARQMREKGSPDRFIWTTGSWLIYEYLEQASPAERAEMEQGIVAGDIAWHTLPFTTHTELMDAELFRFGLSLSKSLDARFDRRTTAAKLTDVPGHTRAIIPLLADAGVSFLHIGVNPGSTVPSVPGLFRWQDPSGAEVIVMYESGYGSAFEIPGLEHSLAFGHTMDNMGPQSTDQVADVFREMRARFTDTCVFASTLSDFAAHLDRVRQTLPIITQEIGDTWIHGIGSDPIKVSRYRELLRLRREWLASGRVAYNERAFINFNRRLLLVPEHTWGMDEKTFLGDHENYSTEKFAVARQQPHFKRFESSWVEKRAYPQLAVNALEDHPLSIEAHERLQAIRPQVPDLAAWQAVDPSDTQLGNSHLSIHFDPTTASISALTHKERNRTWVQDGCLFGALSYQTFSAADYEAFFNTYILPTQRHGWALEDFCKPGLTPAEAESRTWQPQVSGIFRQDTPGVSRLLFRLGFEPRLCQKYGAPASVFLQYTLPEDDPALLIDLQWFKKQACRLPEALWFSFQPVTDADTTWFIEKLGQEISPLEVVENGNRHLHASGAHVACRAPAAGLIISALDSPLVAPGRRSLLNFNNEQPDMREGVHFCLLNNLWGTNFPMWFEEDCRFRFELNFK